VRLRAFVAGAALLLGPVGAARASTPGELDPSFNSSGVVTTAGSQLLGVGVQSNGEVVAAGQSGGRVVVERFTAAGAPDGQYLGPSGVARAVAIQPDGKIVVAGTTAGAMLVERLNSSLTPDSSFGSGGIATAFGGDSGIANAVALGPGGTVVIAGSVNPTDTRFAVARFTASGQPDTSFDGSGTEVPGYDHYSLAQGVAVQPDGKIVLVGSQRPALQVTNGVIARLNADGSNDSSFNGGAFTYSYTASGGAYTTLMAVTLQNNGQIVIGGLDEGGPDALFLRLNANGSFDTGFGSGGAAVLPAGGHINTPPDAPFGAYGVGIAGGGRIVGAGSFVDYGTEVDAAAWALTPGGGAENAFGSGGVVTNPTNGYEACALAIAPDGSLVSAGDTVTTTPDNSPCAVNSGASGFVARYIGYGPPPAPSPSPPPSGGPPSATTGSASGVGEVSATVAGAIKPNGLKTSYHFDYGRTPFYGSSTANGALGAGTATVTVTAKLTGLHTGVRYHYRLVAGNADGTRYGGDRSFTTAPRLSMRLHGLHSSYSISSVRASGLAVRDGCSQPCSLQGSLVITAATAKALGLGKRQLVIGGGSASLRRVGIVTLHLRLTRKVARKLARVKRLVVTLRIVAKPSGGGPAVTISKTVVLQ
jgi:uncharacterized delta-60 repeat protein